MIKMLTAYTFEIDETEDAVNEILEQLDIERNLLKNSLGVVSCYSEYIETGVVEALSEALPFDIVGGTTINLGTSGANGITMLSLSVLTSDDVDFFTFVTKSLEEDLTGIAEAGEVLDNDFTEKPEMVLTFSPLMFKYGGELLMTELRKAVKGIPIFGTNVCDHEKQYATSYTIHNKNIYKDSMVLTFFSGNFEPEFFVSNISTSNYHKQKALITKSSDHILMEVNDMPVLEYLKTLHVSKDDGIEGMNAIPLIVDYNDGTEPAAIASYMIDKDGYLVCGGNMPEGAALSIGTLDDVDVLKTSGNLALNILKRENAGGAIIFSCLSRFNILGLSNDREIKVLDEKLDSIPYSVTYSGGEFCPLYNNDGDTVNRFHNFSIIACVF